MKSPSSRRAILRALDANCNRVREGLRVGEDVARFVLNDPSLTASLKRIRHQVTIGEASLFKAKTERWKARDVGRDRGKGNAVARERVRNSPMDLLKANLKRAQEGLRSLEEFSKLLRHPTATLFKRLRYRCYRIEEGLD